MKYLGIIIIALIICIATEARIFQRGGGRQQHYSQGTSVVARPIAESPKEVVKTDSQLVTEAAERMTNDPLYIAWLEKYLSPKTEINGKQFEAAFANAELEEILNSHSPKQELKERLKRGLKQDFLFYGVPLTDLTDMLRVDCTSNRTLLTPLDNPRARAARERWRKEPLASKVKLALQSGDDFSIVFNTPYCSQNTKGLNALIAVAMGDPLYFKDKQGKTHSLSLTSGTPTEIEKIRKQLSEFWRDEEKLKTFTLVGPPVLQTSPPSDIKITKFPTTPGVHVIPAKNEEIPRIALVYPGNVSGSHIPAAKNSGAEVFIVHNATQAKEVIKKMHEKYGKQMDVIFASHGNHSFMENLISSNDEGTKDMLKSTEGMIKHAYLMGCNVGGGTDYLPNHLLKQFVDHGAESAMGVDKLLWSDGAKFFINDYGGNTVIATGAR